MTVLNVDHEAQLNRMNPASHYAVLGSVLADLIAKHNALLAKLDADATVTDTNYAALLTVNALGEDR